MKPERIWSARPRLPLKDSSSDEPSGPSARTHASRLPRTTALGRRVGVGLRYLHAPARGHQPVVALGLLVAVGLDDQLDRALDAGRRLEHAGREAEDGADVDVLARARRRPRPVIAPAGERADDRHQLARALGELVVHPRRDLAVTLTGQQAVGHHPVQARAELLGRDARQHALELDEAPRSGRQVADDQQRPLVAHQVEGARVRRPLVVRMPLGGRDVWYLGPLVVKFSGAYSARRSTGLMAWTFGLRSAPGQANCALPAQVFTPLAVHTGSGTTNAPRWASKGR